MLWDRASVNEARSRILNSNHARSNTRASGNEGDARYQPLGGRPTVHA